MDCVNAWVEEQRQKNRRRFYELLEEGRQKWTPRNIFNRCCVKWLVDGPLDDDPVDEYNPRNGCTRCSRDHPCITLGFDKNKNATTAILTHLLDPFLNYFDWLVAEGRAIRITRTKYHLDGYLRSNLTALQSYSGFDGHLIKVERGACKASDEAQTAELEERDSGTRAKKCRRLNGSIYSEKLDPDSLEKVLNIAMNERLKLDLQNDPFSLYCMRSVCKIFKEKSESIASEKMKTLNLSITPLVNGTTQYGESKLDGYDSETFDVACWDPYEGATGVVSFTKKEKVELEYHEGVYIPTDTDVATFSWDSGELEEADEYDEEEEYGCENYTYAYRGQGMRVYWHPSDVDPVKSPARVGMWGEELEPLGILVGEIRIGDNPSLGNKSRSIGRHASIEYEVLQSNETVREEEKSTGPGDDSDDDDNSRRKGTRYIRYRGTVKITQLKIDYSLLVRKHAQCLVEDLQWKHTNIEMERPLTKYEKSYKKLALLASNKKAGGWDGAI